MSLSAAALRLMAEKGLSALDIAEIAEAMEVRRDPTAAERQQRRRDKVKAERDASRVTSRRDASPHDNNIAPQQDSPDETIVSSSPKSGRSRNSTGMHPLPDGWVPVLTPAAQKIIDGWPPGWLEARVAEFRDHATDKGRKSKDWQAAFRTWITKADEWQRQRGQHGNDRKSGANGNRGRDGFLNACREAAAAQAAHAGAGDG